MCYPNIRISTANYETALSITNNELKIEYNTESTLKDALFIQSSSLLFESDIRAIDDKWNPAKNCLEEFTNDTTLGFDVFAAMFHQLCRYEEYLSYPLDKYGRFNSAESGIVKAKQQLNPWVDVYAKQFLDLVKKSNPKLDTSPKEYQCQPTIDVDIAYKFLGRNLFRTVGALVKNIVKPKGLSQRLKVLIHLDKDPFFIFDSLKETNALYFIHVGEFGPVDKSCGLSKKEFQSFLQALPNDNIGLHPSFQSHLDFDELCFEQEQLEEISTHTITKSRQHFIKLLVPETYELLIELGINKDFSMGWPDIPGFRAGTTHSHYFFNINTNTQTDLKLFPFAWMDAHFIYHNQLDQMEDLFNQLKKEHQTYGGYFTPIFHNNHFSELPFSELLNKLIQCSTD